MNRKLFEINLKPKRKSFRKRFKRLTRTLKPKKTCHHRIYMDYDTGDQVCLKCYQIVDKIYINENFKIKNNDILIWNRDYDKDRWILESLDYMKGDHNDKLNTVVWYDLCKEVPNPCTWYDIYQTFHKCGLTDFWICFPSYVGMKVPITKTVLYMTMQYSSLGYTKYRISFMYLMYKFAQMENEDTAIYVPLKGSKAWVKKTDAWWKTVCEQKEWVFYPTKMHKLFWNKEEIVQSLGMILKSYEVT